MRTRGHLRKIEPCTRSCGWPDLLPEGQEETGLEEAPLLIPGAMPAGRVIHPIQDHEEGLLGADQVVGQEGDSTGQQEQAGEMVEQGQGVPDCVEEPVVEAVPESGGRRGTRTSSITRGSDGSQGDV